MPAFSAAMQSRCNTISAGVSLHDVQGTAVQLGRFSECKSNPRVFGTSILHPEGKLFEHSLVHGADVSSRVLASKACNRV
jgi:hypothetical protein